MSRNQRDNRRKMELKYCEHCGGLWVREPGASVYCPTCEPKVAELPVPKKSSGRVKLPKPIETVVDRRGAFIAPEAIELEAVGGVA